MINLTAVKNYFLMKNISTKSVMERSSTTERIAVAENVDIVVLYNGITDEEYKKLIKMGKNVFIEGFA